MTLWNLTFLKFWFSILKKCFFMDRWILFLTLTIYLLVRCKNFWTTSFYDLIILYFDWSSWTILLSGTNEFFARYLIRYLWRYPLVCIIIIIAVRWALAWLHFPIIIFTTYFHSLRYGIANSSFINLCIVSLHFLLIKISGNHHLLVLLQTLIWWRFVSSCIQTNVVNFFLFINRKVLIILCFIWFYSVC